MIQRSALLFLRLFGKPWIIFIAKVLFAVIALIFVFKLVDIHAVIKTFTLANPSYFLWGFALIPLNLGIRILRWRVFLQTLNEKPGWRETIRSVMFGITVGSFTPAEIGDFAGRILHLPEAKKTLVIGLTFLDRTQISLVFFLVGTPALILMFLKHTVYSFIIALMVITISIGAIVFLGKSGERFTSLLSRFSLLKRISQGIFSIDYKQQFYSVILAFLFLLTVGLQMYFFINSFFAIGLADCIVAISMIICIKSFLPISIGDLGIRELTSAFIFSYYGITYDISVNASLMIFIANVFIPALIGIPFIQSSDFSIFLATAKHYSKNNVDQEIQ